MNHLRQSRSFLCGICNMYPSCMSGYYQRIYNTKVLRSKVIACWWVLEGSLNFLVARQLEESCNLWRTTYESNHLPPTPVKAETERDGI